MKRLARTLGPALVLLSLAACAASNRDERGVTNVQPTPACMQAGAKCRWDEQCCSGRCYVDTGCSG